MNANKQNIGKANYTIGDYARDMSIESDYKTFETDSHDKRFNGFGFTQFSNTFENWKSIYSKADNPLYIVKYYIIDLTDYSRDVRVWWYLKD